MHLSYKLYFTTVNSSKGLQKETISADDSQKSPHKSIREKKLKTLQNMRIDEASDLFYECASVEGPKNKFSWNIYLESENILTINRLIAIFK